MSMDVLSAFKVMVPRERDAWMVRDAAARSDIEANIVLFPSYALPSCSHPSVIFGCVMAHGVGTLWMLVGENFEKEWRGVFRRQKEILGGFFKSGILRRIQILIDAACPENIRYARGLGFAQESAAPHKGMGPHGEDMLIFVYTGKEGKK